MARPTAAANRSGQIERRNRNAVLRFSLSADCDFGGGVRLRRRRGDVSGDREDSLLRFHRTFHRVVNYSYVAAGLASPLS